MTRAPRVSQAGRHRLIGAFAASLLLAQTGGAAANDLLGAFIPTPLARFLAAPPGGVADGWPPIAAPDLAGRWKLDSSGIGVCYVAFSGRPGAVAGVISPESGCPRALFASRRWTADPGGVTIADRRGAPLAHLTPVRRGRFEGEADGGRWISMTR